MREAPWLTAARGRAYMIILALVLAVSAVGVAGSRFGSGARTVTDFIPFYAAGIMVREGHPVGAYRYDALVQVEARYADVGHGVLPFMYPPVFLVFCGWIAALPQAGAYAVFEALGLLPLLLCLWWMLRQRRWAILPLLAAPAFLVNLGSGQSGFFAAAAFAGAAVLIERFPGLAGACLGLLVFKPHFALLVPVALLAAGRWRALTCCAAVAALLCGLSLVDLHLSVWQGFFAQAAMMRHVLERSTSGLLAISPFGAVHAAGAGLTAAFAVQAVCTVLCAAAVIVAARRRSDGRGEIALVAAAALCATPYAMDYDLAVTMVPIVWITAEAQQTGWRPWEKFVLAVAYLLPLFARVSVLLIGVQPAPLVLGVLLLLTWRRVVGRS